MLEKNVQFQEMNKEYNQNEQWILDREDKLEDVRYLSIPFFLNALSETSNIKRAVYKIL